MPVGEATSSEVRGFTLPTAPDKVVVPVPLGLRVRAWDVGLSIVLEKVILPFEEVVTAISAVKLVGIETETDPTPIFPPKLTDWAEASGIVRAEVPLMVLAKLMMALGPLATKE